MKRIGILSDTHGTFDERLREFFRDVDEIWHAGDIGSLALADRIAAFKPLRSGSGHTHAGRNPRPPPPLGCGAVRPVFCIHAAGKIFGVNPRHSHCRPRRPAHRRCDRLQ